MRNRTDCSSICSTQWQVSSSTCSGEMALTNFRIMPARTYKTLRASNYGKTFNVMGLTWDQLQSLQRKIDDENLILGYASRRYSRPFCFINLKLSPASRRFAAAQLRTDIRLGNQDCARFWAFIRRVSDDGEYIEKVISAPYFAAQRKKWETYVLTGKSK